MSLAFQREFSLPDDYIPEKCCFCNQEIQMYSQAVKFKNCPHEAHKTCLVDAMELSSNTQTNKCKTCQKPILDGYEEALKLKPMKPNKVI